MKGMKKPLALLLALVMAFGLMNVSAWADEAEAPEEEPAQIEEAAPETPAEPADEEAAEAPEDEEAFLLAGAYVAQVGQNYYDSLAGAIAAIESSGAIELVADISDMDTVQIPEGKEITLDLAGHVITAALNVASEKPVEVKHKYAIDNYGTLTLKDSVGDGQIRARGIQNKASGVMVMESGEIVSLDGNGGAGVWNEGDLTINGGKITCTYSTPVHPSYGAGCVNTRSDAKTVINDGEFNSVSQRCYAICSEGGETTINNATVSGGHGAVAFDAGENVINAGTFTATNYYGLYVSNDGGEATATVNGGTFTGGSKGGYTSVLIGSDVNNPVDSTIYIKGGTFTQKLTVQNNVNPDAGIIVTGGTFLGGLNVALLGAGYAINHDGVVIDKIAKVGDTAYDTLQAAVDAAQAGDTVTLLGSAIGNGVKVVESKPCNITIDFDQYTYTVNKTVGSTGTETQGFHIERGSTVTLKNGSIRSPLAILLLQNYCDLTLEDMNLDMSEASQVTYVCSNNNGSLTVKGNTVIKASPGQRAFDLYFWPKNGTNYVNGETVTFGPDFTGTVEGKIEYDSDHTADGENNSNWFSKSVLVINSPNATFNVTFDDAIPDDANITITGGKFPKGVGAKFFAPGYGQDSAGRVYQKTMNVAFIPAAEGSETRNLVTLPATLEAGTYKLLTDVTIDEPIYLKSGNIDVTIDLNGKTLTSTVDANRAFYLDTTADGGGIQNVNVEIKNGTFSFPKAARAFQFNKGTSNVSLKIGEGAVINLPNGTKDWSVISVWGAGNKVELAETAEITSNVYGITLFGGAEDKSSVTVNGTIKALTPVGTNGSNTLSGTITVGEKAVLESTGGDHAMYLPGKVDVTIAAGANADGAKLSGGDAIYIKSGSLTIEGGEFNATSERKVYEYYGNGGRFTGDAIVVDNCSYPGGAPTVEIKGGTFTSANGSAVGSYAYGKTDDADNVPIVCFISGGTFIGAFGEPALTTDGTHKNKDVATSLLASGKRLDGDGKVVDANATLTKGEAPASTDETQETTYTAQPTSGDPYAITVTSQTNDANSAVTVGENQTLADITDGKDVAKDKVDLGDIKMDVLLSDLIDKKVTDNDNAAVDAQVDSATSVEFAMTATTQTGATQSSITLDIHPTFKVGNGDAQTLPNKYIKQPMKVVIPHLFKGLKVLSILHKAATGNQYVSFKQETDGTLWFTSDSFSEFDITIKPDKTENTAATMSAYTQTAVDGNDTVNLPEFTTTANVYIMGAATASKKVTLSAYDAVIILPKGLTYDGFGSLIKVGEKTNSDGTTTIQFRNYGANESGGAYYEFPASGAATNIGYFTVKANTDAVYNADMAVRLDSLTIGKTGVEGQAEATVDTATLNKATFKLTKTYTIKFDQLSDGTDANYSTNRTKSADIVVGHNKKLSDTAVTQFDTTEAEYFTNTTDFTPKNAIGYTFTGWSPSLETSAAVTADATYTAQWTAISYTVKYAEEHRVGQQKDWTPYAELTYNIQTGLNIPEPTKDAYEFAGWEIKSTDNGANGTWTITNDGKTNKVKGAITGANHYGNVTLTATWTPHEYAITFADTGYEYVKDKSDTAHSVTGVTATTAEGTTTYTYNIETGIGNSWRNAGYRFDGWEVTAISSATDHEKWEEKHYEDVGENFVGYYGDVSLKPHFVLDTVVVFKDYAFAFTGQGLMLVKWTADDNQELTFTIPGATAEASSKSYKLYATNNAKYVDAFNASVGESDKITSEDTVYVTIVPLNDLRTLPEGGGAYTVNRVTYRYFDIVAGAEETTAANTEVSFTGDVIQKGGAAIPEDGSSTEANLTLADLSNANDLLAVPDMFDDGRPNILGRLNADFDTDAIANLNDLVKIQAGIPTVSSGN